MKMITAVVNKHDALEVCEVLKNSGYEFTKLATVGGFLKSSNTTLLMGVEDENLEAVLDLIRRNCARRTEDIPLSSVTEKGIYHATHPTAVVVGGAVVFVTDVAYFEKM